MTVEAEEAADGLDALRIVRISELRKLLDVSAPTIYRMEARGELPRRRRFSANVVGWTVAELKAWAATRPASLTERTEP